MKRFFVLAAALLLAACQVPIGNGGTLKVVLPGSGNRASIAGDTAVRLQLTRNNNIVPLSGSDFLEKSLSGQTVSIDGLVPGPGYVLLVSTGSRNPGETFYRTNLFQKSAPFEISAGTDTAVTVTLDTTNVAVIEANNSSVHSATVKGSALFYLDGNKVSTTTNLSLTATPETVAPYYSGSLSNVNGLSTDSVASQLWLNTATGVFAESGGAGSGSFPIVLMTDSDGNTITPSVTDSGKIQLIGISNANTNTFSYYFGAGFTAGLQVGSETSWHTMDELLKVGNLKDKLQGQIIRGVASAGTFAILTTSIGAFRVEENMLTSASDLGSDFTNGKNAADNSSIVIQASDTSLVINPVSAISDSGTNVVFGGTANGLYASNVTASGAPTATGDGQTLTLVSGTQGLSITRLATYGSLIGGSVYTAAYSANTREVLVLRGTTVVSRVSAFAGLPSGDPRLTLYKDSSTALYLVVTGSDASVKIPISTL